MGPSSPGTGQAYQLACRQACHRASYRGEQRTDTVTYKEQSHSGTNKEVTRTEEFIELHLIGNKDERTRLYKDKCSTWSKSSGEWIETCRGKWGD